MKYDILIIVLCFPHIYIYTYIHGVYIYMYIIYISLTPASSLFRLLNFQYMCSAIVLLDKVDMVQNFSAAWSAACSKEHLCKDEWSAYCWDKSWGSCPVSCTGDQTYCSSYVYDSEGHISVLNLQKELQRNFLQNSNMNLWIFVLLIFL